MSLTAIGILSIGEMGFGIAQLLRAHNYRVLTYAADRSAHTQHRAWLAEIELRPSLQDLIDNSDVLLSIVPPDQALSTADRIIAAASARHLVRSTPLYIFDLNAVSPSTAREMAQLYATRARAEDLVFLQGGIIGTPPRLVATPSSSPTTTHSTPLPATSSSSSSSWKKPTIILSGPGPLPIPPTLTTILNIRHISPEYGTAAAVKMCFAALTKGFTALAIESFTTAQGFGVLPALREMLAEHKPAMLGMAERGVVGMPSKAYRWAGEMREIGGTVSEGGGFSPEVFNGIAEVYAAVAADPVLGEERHKVKREHGVTVEEVVGCLQASLKEKTE
ncbi:6-phosphogluconate dehydrogenase C-terminal domain-like protein [Aspergillus saccharolyticus JOP 1030-1]|uniref:6-phosphogluconate dehydrogenase C-terminal domain-like protein n=1 Tax=Aspergillus saccharolyticus JOP 1030-1 TaxID=1450539 RepID=A0A319A1U2_9EURO|nr:6-phosphogluconate dehydrogenase C-terminal domain-like protein [Aspergillus saccharolyticus JOP 1030-1]PYH46248.1 6-phosphogluconate dehydrogenase C-terminal domain-like protein [Aspergillus saccharolyticus JOP 1030-1]